MRLGLNVRIDLKLVTLKAEGICAGAAGIIERVSKPHPKIIALRENGQVKVAEPMRCICSVLRASRKNLRTNDGVIFEVVKVLDAANV